MAGITATVAARQSHTSLRSDSFQGLNEPADTGLELCCWRVWPSDGRVLRVDAHPLICGPALHGDPSELHIFRIL